MLHEKRHVLQILEHTALSPYDVSAGGARVGWSGDDGPNVLWRTRANIQNGLYNHFWAGPDGAPGKVGINDDAATGDTETDELDEFIAGPGDTVVQGSDDVDLDPDGDGISHLVPTDPDPAPNAFDGSIVDNQAKACETSPQDTFREFDWGSPGKQHGPDLSAQNSYEEINSYGD